MEKHPMRRTALRGGAVVATAALALGLTACSGGSVTGNSADADGKTKILVWTQVTGDATTTLDQIVDDYNAASDDYVIETQYAGVSDQFTAKLLNAVQTSAPHLLRYLTAAVLINRKQLRSTNYSKNILKGLHHTRTH